MLKIYKKPRTIFTLVITSFVIFLALLGSNWQIGQAGDATIPEIYTYEPDLVCANSDSISASVSGDKFINYEGDFYTWISWLGPNDTQPSYIIPDNINVAGTLINFTIDATKLTNVGSARFWVVNHPEYVPPFEIVGPFYIDIVGCNFIYLPLVMK